MAKSVMTRFGLNNRGTKACLHCGILSWQSRQDHESTGEICVGCFEAAGYENEHEDGYHADRVEPQCPTCNPAGEAKRMAKAAARVASYGAVAAQRAAQAAVKEAQYPHCSHCGQRRPKTKAWEKDHSVALLCSDCKYDFDQVDFERNVIHDEARAVLHERSLASRKARHSGGN